MATAAATTTCTTTTTTVLSMKLLIDTKVQRVLFAEAGKDVVDFLFSFLALPVSTAVKLVGKDSMAGSVGTLYSSFEELDDTSALQLQGALLRPTATSPAAASRNGSLLGVPEPSLSGQAKTTFYRCSFSSLPAHSCAIVYVTDAYGKACPQCGSSMTTAAQYRYLPAGEPAAAGSGAGKIKGPVQGMVMYTVMDNLKVTPMSAISTITLLNSLAVTDTGALQEKEVQVGYNEGLEILKASLQSKTVLTDVFLGNKKACVVDVNNMDYVVC